MRAGTGWDLHRLVKGRPLMIGGVEIPLPRVRHSDGDVLVHPSSMPLGASLLVISSSFPRMRVQMHQALIY